VDLPALDLEGALFLQTFVTVLVIMDPIGSVPIFLSLTRHQDEAGRRRSALQAAAVATGVILVFALFGQQILHLLGISLEALQVAGGLLLLLIALELLRGDEEEPSAAVGTNVALVPLGTPLLAGPGAIAATMLYMRQADTLGGNLSVVAALVAALGVIYVSMRWSTHLMKVLRANGIHLLSRVMGLLVAAIAVQLAAEAIERWAREGVG
jgi:multiple antibiotic resistance protein